MIITNSMRQLMRMKGRTVLFQIGRASCRERV